MYASEGKKEDNAKATKAICNYIRSVYFVIDKKAMYDLVLT